MASNQNPQTPKQPAHFTSTGSTQQTSVQQTESSEIKSFLNTARESLKSDQTSEASVQSNQASKAKISTMPASQSSTSSVRTASASIDSGSRPLLGEQRSSFGKVMDKARSKIAGVEKLPSSEADLERAKTKEIEKQRRKEEYERLGLGDRTKYGIPGAGGWNA